MFEKIFGSMYEADDRDRAAFKEHYLENATLFKHGEEQLVARYRKEPSSDGFDVDVYEVRMPARFFKVVVLPSANSVGEERAGCEINTGSGAEELAARLAEEFSRGMLDVCPSTKKAWIVRSGPGNVDDGFEGDVTMQGVRLSLASAEKFAEEVRGHVATVCRLRGEWTGDAKYGRNGKRTWHRDGHLVQVEEVDAQ